MAAMFDVHNAYFNSYLRNNEYHPTTNSWHKITFIPRLQEKQVLKGFAMAPISNSIYIIGGRICQKLRPEIEARMR
ncbi:hypothetical protein QQ045_026747 [Rhodiola kirilowii]